MAADVAQSAADLATDAMDRGDERDFREILSILQEAYSYQEEFSARCLKRAVKEGRLYGSEDGTAGSGTAPDSPHGGFQGGRIPAPEGLGL